MTMDLNEAIAEFDAAETTLRRLESVWDRLRQLIPQGLAILGDSPEGIEYENLCRAFRDLVGGLPTIAGYRIDMFPVPVDEIAQDRIDAQDIGFLDAIVGVEDAIAAPGEAIREYRYRFDRERRKIARTRTLELVAEIDNRLAAVRSRVESNSEPIADHEWPELVDAIREIERLAGSSTPRRGRWRELSRHMAWAQGVDLHDIAEHDWPSVLVDINEGLYTETEPMQIRVDDLADLAAARPAGRVSTKLNWGALDDEGFERLVFNLISTAPDYENPRWLTKTRAADRGRDLSVDRVYRDALSGVRRQRVVISCKHWLSKSLDPHDVQEALTMVPLCEPPTVDALVIATSGRFTGNAVDMIERHNDSRLKPQLDPWPESHLESLLAQRPDLVPPGLRPV